MDINTEDDSDIDHIIEQINKEHEHTKQLFIDLKTDMNTCVSIGDLMQIVEDRFDRCRIIGEYLIQLHSPVGVEEELLIRVNASLIKLKDIKDEFLDWFC